MSEPTTPDVALADFRELGGGAEAGMPADMRLLFDVPLEVTVELGRASMRVRDLLTLREGSVVELNRTPGAAVDVLVNGKLVARGDVVVVDDEFGVRVTEVVDPEAGL